MPSVLLISALSCAVFGNSWNFFIQFFYQFIAISVFLFIFLYDLSKGNFNLEKRELLIFATLALMIISWAFSPVRSLLSWELINFIAGLSIYFSSSRLKQEIEKRKILVYFVFSIVALVAIWQFVFHKEIYSTLGNANTLAFYAILAGGLCLKWGNYYLALVFAVLLIISKSAGAVISVFVSTLLYAFDRKAFKNIKENSFLFLSVAVMLLVTILSVDIASIYDRLSWWKAALNMIAYRPVYGWGEGAFAYVSSAFKTYTGDLASVYAHNYYLEFIAENAIVASLLWFYVLFSFIRTSSGILRYVIVAAVVHSFFDFGLSCVYSFWLFCFIIAMSAENKSEVVISGKFLYQFLFLSVTLMLNFLYYGVGNIKKERLILKSEKDWKYFSQVLLEKEKKPRDYDYLSYVAGKLLLKATQTRDLSLLAESAKTYEQKLIVNPWNAADYVVLDKIYSLMKEDDIRKELAIRSRDFLRWRRKRTNTL